MTMAFPQEVLEVKEWLKASSEHCSDKKAPYETIRKLTEADKENDEAYGFPALEKMWATLKEHSHPEDMEDGRWVSSFVQAVTRFSQPPAFYYRSNKENQATLQEIKKISSRLVELYEGNDLDAQIVLNNKKLLSVEAQSRIPGFYIYEDLYDVEKSQAGSSEYLDERKDEEFISFSRVISFFAERSEDLMKGALNQRGKMSGNVQAIRFIRNLGRYIRATYDAPLNQIVCIVAFALYGVAYEPSDIANLQNR